MGCVVYNIGMYEGMPKSINIVVKYEGAIEAIVGRKEDKMIMNENALFLFLLQSVFTSYSEIPKRYPPGILGFLLNDSPPKDSTILMDGDVVTIFAR
jgi:molybdopterin converting factor small subunit